MSSNYVVVAVVVVVVAAVVSGGGRADASGLALFSLALCRRLVGC